MEKKRKTPAARTSLTQAHGMIPAKRPTKIPAKEPDISAQSPVVPIVGIGASAGGMEAVTALLKALPPDTGMAFVVIQHLDPRHPSMLTEILAKTTRMKVVEVKGDVTVHSNMVYVISPATDLTLERRRLRLTPRSPAKTPHRPVDTFLQSLAADADASAIAVILSGTGSDGTQGVKAVKEAGGLTFAQDVTAAHHGMPDSAVAAECVDFVLPPEQIATELARIANRPCLSRGTESAPASASAAAPEKDGFARILQMLAGTGIDFMHYKQPTLRRRIDRRMVLRRLESLDEYLACLRSDPGELQALFHEMLIQVTSFFRDPETFEELKSAVFPKLLEDRPPEATLRLWVPGCSTGEEAYSIAICLVEYLRTQAAAPNFKIFATDVSEPAIDEARAGIYQDSVLAEVSPERIHEFFAKTDAGYQIIKSIRDACIFAKQNVTRDPPFSQLDLISCRNVLIYLGAVLQNRVFPVFHYALRPGGFLVLGSAESIGSFNELFEPFDKKHRFYRRTGTVSRLAFDYAPVAGHGTALPRPGLPADPMFPAYDVQREADRMVLAKYAPAGVVIDEAMQILQFRGHTGAVLEPAPGAPNNNLLQMAREGLLPELRAAIEAARVSGLSERRTGVRVKSNGHFVEFNLEVTPLAIPSSTMRCFVVLFEEAGPAVHGGQKSQPARTPSRVKNTSATAHSEADEQLRDNTRLAQELAATKSYLQSVIEAKEAANEELKAANEEIISSNEELQSTNEELETAKEELQATNEELATVNDELHDRIRVTTQLNDDLANLIDSLNIPVLILSQDLRLRRFSPSAQKVLSLRPGDIGRRISDFKSKINVPELVPLIHHVLDKLQTDEREVRDAEERWYTLTIRPYRTADNKIDGAILSLTDIDALKRKEQQIVVARDLARNIIESLRGALLVLDEHLRIRYANRAFYDLFQITAEDTDDQLIYALSGGQWNIPPLRSLLDEVISTTELLRDFRVESEFPKIGRRTMLINARRTREQEGDALATRIVLSIEDLTDRENAERTARQTAARMQAVVETAADAVVTFDGRGVVESFNRAGEIAFGYPLDRIIGQPITLLMASPFADEFAAELRRFAEKGIRDVITRGRLILGRRLDGTTFPVELTVSEVASVDGHLLTAFLRDVGERRALEREVLEIAAYEQRRIGQDLHDTTGQALSGLSYLARDLAAGLKSKGVPEAETAHTITDELERALEQVRRISSGLVPVEVDSAGLMAALQGVVDRVGELSGVRCLFECTAPVLVEDNQTATQLFLIAQEALANALKHGRPHSARIILQGDGDQLKLEIHDDGVGIDAPQSGTGMGLKIMNYRAGLIGGRLSVERSGATGTCVTCLVPWTRKHGGKKNGSKP